MCRVYLARAQANGAHETFLGRADALFDLCYGLPGRFRSKDGAPNPLTEERKAKIKAARIHLGYGNLPAADFIPLHIDEWLRAHKSWKGSRRTKIQAIKKAFSYAHKSGLIPENRIKKYPVPRARSRATYITPEQEAILVESASEPLAMAIQVCVRTGARYFSEPAVKSQSQPSGVRRELRWEFDSRGVFSDGR